MLKQTITLASDRPRGQPTHEALAEENWNRQPWKDGHVLCPVLQNQQVPLYVLCCKDKQSVLVPLNPEEPSNKNSLLVWMGRCTPREMTVDEGNASARRRFKNLQRPARWWCGFGHLVYIVYEVLSQRQPLSPPSIRVWTKNAYKMLIKCFWTKKFAYIITRRWHLWALWHTDWPCAQ